MKIDDVKDMTPAQLDELCNRLMGTEGRVYTCLWSHGLQAIRQLAERDERDERYMLKFMTNSKHRECYVGVIRLDEPADEGVWWQHAEWETISDDRAMALARGIVALGIARGELC